MKKVCILYSNAGAGHKSAANALAEVYKESGNWEVIQINFAEKYHVKGFNEPGRLYKFFLKYLANFYGIIIWLVDRDIIMHTLTNFYRQAAEKYFATFLQEFKADLYISTYYFDYDLLNYIKHKQSASRTVMLVTDIVYPLKIWLQNKVDLILVPTKELYDNASKYFQDYKEKVTIMGLPITQDYFSEYSQTKLKAKLGLNSEKLVLVFGGGEGNNKVPTILKKIDSQNKNISIVVICGKDTKQKNFLEKLTFQNKVKILGWVDNFSEYLLASDAVVTKAGPTTIWEALTAKKRLYLFDWIKGQENGNIEFAIKHGAAEFLTEDFNLFKTTTKNSGTELLLKNSAKGILSHLD